MSRVIVCFSAAVVVLVGSSVPSPAAEPWEGLRLGSPRGLLAQHPAPSEFDVVYRGQEAGEEEDSIETDRPDFTEASSVVPRGMIQLEMGYTFVYDDNEADGAITRGHSGPEILVRYGLTDLVELRLFWNYLWERTIDGGVATDTDGAEDLTVGTKISLLEQEEWLPESAVILEFSTPTGADAFSNRHVEFGLNLLYGWDLPYDLALGGSTGYSTGTEVLDVLPVLGPPLQIEDRHNIFHQSVTVGYPIVGELRGYMEYFGLYFDGRAEGGPEHYIDGGFTYLLNNDTQLDFRAGHGLSDAADDLFGGVGLSVRR